MNAALNHQQQKAIDKWLEEVGKARKELEEARKKTGNPRMVEQGEALDRAWARYFRVVMAKEGLHR